MNYRLITLLVITLVMLFVKKSNANHAAGIDMFYTYIPGTNNFYEVTIRFYRDCGGIQQQVATEPPQFTLYYGNTCDSLWNVKVLNKIVGNIPTNPSKPNGSEIYQSCLPTTCTDINSNQRGYRQWWYRGTISLAGSCSQWRLRTTLCCRLNSSLNLGPNNTLNTVICGEASVNTSVPMVGSPLFNYEDSSYKVPVIKSRINVPYTHVGGAIDPDNDSLVFKTIDPMGADYTANINNITSILMPGAIPPYNTLDVNGNPFQCNNSYNLNTSTGHFGFTPNTIGNWVISHKVSKYRNGVLLGHVTRDMLVVVDNMPVASLNNVNVCQGDNFVLPDSTLLTNIQADTTQVLTYTSSNNCDSIIVTNIHVDSTQVSIIQNGFDLVANLNIVGGYQWMTCNPFAPIPNAINSTYTPTSSGNYAVSVINNGCSDTSACFSYILTQESFIADNPQIEFYPNPAKDYLYANKSLATTQTAFVYDITGRLILVSNTFPLAIQKLSVGHYLLRYNNHFFKFRKEE